VQTNELQGFNMAKKMIEFGTRDIPLNWEVFVTPSIAVVISELPAGVKQPHNAWQRMG